MFTEKDLIAGETVLVRKQFERKVLYLGSAGLSHFISEDDEFKTGRDSYYTIEDLNNFFTIEQPKSKVVPLGKKVYDFVPVIVRDNPDNNWKNRFLIAVTPGTEYQFKTVDKNGQSAAYRYCEFLNEQP